MALFFATAVAEIVGCFLPYLWLRKDGSIWLLLPAALQWLLLVQIQAARSDSRRLFAELLV